MKTSLLCVAFVLCAGVAWGASGFGGFGTGGVSLDEYRTQIKAAHQESETLAAKLRDLLRENNRRRKLAGQDPVEMPGTTYSSKSLVRARTVEDARGELARVKSEVNMLQMKLIAERQAGMALPKEAAEPQPEPDAQAQVVTLEQVFDYNSACRRIDGDQRLTSLQKKAEVEKLAKPHLENAILSGTMIVQDARETPAHKAAAAQTEAGGDEPGTAELVLTANRDDVTLTLFLVCAKSVAFAAKKGDDFPVYCRIEPTNSKRRNNIMVREYTRRVIELDGFALERPAAEPDAAETPEAESKPTAVLVTLKDGRTIKGIAAEKQTDGTVRVTVKPGMSCTFRADEVESIAATGTQTAAGPK